MSLISPLFVSRLMASQPGRLTGWKATTTTTRGNGPGRVVAMVTKINVGKGATGPQSCSSFAFPWAWTEERRKLMMMVVVDGYRDVKRQRRRREWNRRRPFLIGITKSAKRTVRGVDDVVGVWMGRPTGRTSGTGEQDSVAVGCVRMLHFWVCFTTRNS